MNWWQRFRLRLALSLAPCAGAEEAEPEEPCCPTCGLPGEPMRRYHDSTHEEFRCPNRHRWQGRKFGRT